MSRTSATSSVFFSRISDVAAKSRLLGPTVPYPISPREGREEVGLVLESRGELQRAAASVVLGKHDRQQGIGRVDPTEIGLEEALGIGLV